MVWKSPQSWANQEENDLVSTVGIILSAEACCLNMNIFPQNFQCN
jgi:hypothetical protein